MLPERSQDSLLASMDFIFTLLAIPLMAVTLLVGLFLCLCYCIQYGFAEFYLLLRSIELLYTWERIPSVFLSRFAACSTNKSL